MNDLNNNLIRAIVPILVVLIIAFAALSGLTVIVQSGHVGIIRTLGAVQQVALPEGLHFKKPFMDQVEQMDVRLAASNALATAASSDLQTVTTQVTTQFSINGDLAPLIFQKVGTLSRVAATIVEPAIQESVKGVTAKFTAEELVTKRDVVKSQIQDALTNFINTTLREKGLENAITIALQSGAFSDLDAVNTHVATDWEIWTTFGMPSRVWRALNQTGAQRLNATLANGVFENALAGRTALIWGTAYQLRVRHRDSSGESNSEWSPSAKRDFTTPVAPWNVWRNAEFTAAELADNNISGENADPDRDGFVNLLENAFKLPPKSASVSPVAISEITADAIYVTFPLSVDATDLVVTVQHSTDLSSWSSTGVTYETLGVGGGVQAIRARVPRLGIGSKQFVRVQINKP